MDIAYQQEEFAPAKINLTLHLVGRRIDFYHQLDSVVAFATLGDRLSLTVTLQSRPKIWLSTRVV